MNCLEINIYESLTIYQGSKVSDKDQTLHTCAGSSGKFNMPIIVHGQVTRDGRVA